MPITGAGATTGARSPGWSRSATPPPASARSGAKNHARSQPADLRLTRRQRVGPGVHQLAHALQGDELALLDTGLTFGVELTADHPGVADSHQALGVLPTQDTLVLERFFDESGGMQLVLHAPFGSRINRAWGLALRKRFCGKFNFEIQAAATEEGVILSLGEVHSFALLQAVRETLASTTSAK